MRRRLMPVAALLAALAVPLAGCDVVNDILGRDTKPRLPGERVAVMEAERTLEADAELARQPMALPRPVANADWPQAGGNAAHVMQHLAAGEQLAVSWRAGIGSSAGYRQRFTAAPVVVGGRVYALDADARVSVLDAASGGEVWRFDARPEEERDGQMGGGLAVAGGRVFVATGLAEMVALDAATGEQRWRHSLPGPARGAPAVAGEGVFISTLDGQVVALAADDGHQLWAFRGIGESATLLGIPAPAVESGVVVAGLASGELVALRADSGRLIWSESLASGRGRESLTDLGAIRGRAAVDRGRVFAAGNSGLMAAIDLRTGRRVWEREIGSQESPWVAGDYVFVLTTDNELVALTRADGRIRWVTRLERWQDPERRRNPITWTGPVLVGDRLVVAGSTAEALSVSPYTGEVLGRQSLPGPVRVAPVVAGGTLFLLTDDAELLALR